MGKIRIAHTPSATFQNYFQTTGSKSSKNSSAVTQITSKNSSTKIIQKPTQHPITIKNYINSAATPSYKLPEFIKIKVAELQDKAATTKTNHKPIFLTTERVNRYRESRQDKLYGQINSQNVTSISRTGCQPGVIGSGNPKTFGNGKQNGREKNSSIH